MSGLIARVFCGGRLAAEMDRRAAEHATTVHGLLADAVGRGWPAADAERIAAEELALSMPGSTPVSAAVAQVRAEERIRTRLKEAR